MNNKLLHLRCRVGNSAMLGEVEEEDSVEVEGVEGGEEVKMERETVALHPEGGVGCRPAGTRVTTTRSLWATNRTIVEEIIRAKTTEMAM